MSVKEWLKRIVPRAMGMCMALREDPMDLPLDKIEAKLVESDTYSRDRLAQATKDLNAKVGWGADEWKAFADTQFAEEFAWWEKRKAEIDLTRSRYKDALKIIDKLRNRLHMVPGTEVTQNTLKFASEQVMQSLQFDSHSLPKPVKKCWEDARDHEMAKLSRDVSYHTEELKKAAERNKSRLTAWREYQTFIDEEIEK
jgi:uncharacterized protein (UPF0128 family)